MSRVRRTRYVAFGWREETTVDVVALLGGRVDLVPFREAVATSVLSGEELPVSLEELQLAAAAPEEWIDGADLLAGREPEDAGRLEELARKGVLVTDGDDPELAELRRRDEKLAEDHWSAVAALYHFGARWRGVRVDLGPDVAGATTAELFELAAAELERLGKPPPHFVRRAGDLLPLPAEAREGQLYDALLRRRTSRAFDRHRPLTAAQLAVLLRYVWGAHGLAELAEETAMVKKTSPSGGGLHPIEVYPLVRDVEGVEPGLYHYAVGEHALEPVTLMDPAAVEELALDLVAGQTYFQAAHVFFLMTARFDRSFWKYRDHRRAYGVILMDAGHLSQTLYLVATELGLGVFVTAAINGANVEDALGIDGFREGAIAICGCGPPGPAPPGLEPLFAPYGR